MNAPAKQQPKSSPVERSLTIIKERVLTKDLARDYSHRKPRKIDLKFASEKLFFMEHIRRNRDLAQAIIDNRVIMESFTQAFLQAASIGLSFNPTLAHCYLIPRRIKKDSDVLVVYASPGYRGMLHQAERGGAIKCGRAEVVHRGDHFRYFGPTTKPEFEAGGRATENARFNALAVNRGERVGVFCEAQLSDGTWLADMMDRDQIKRVIEMSDNPGSMMYDPNKFEEEGWKKIIIRRAWKTWPKAASVPLLAYSMQILNEYEGVDPDKHDALPAATVLLSEEQLNELHAMVVDAGVEQNKVGAWLRRLAQASGVEEIDELPREQFDAAKELLRATLAKRKSK